MSIVEVISPDYIKVMSGVGLGIVGTLAVTWVRQVDIAHAQQRITAFLREEDERDTAWLRKHQAEFAIEAEKPHEAEVLHVEYPTAELRTLAADPQVADGLARLADEVGLAQALSDRPADDEDEVGDEQPGEATSTAVPRLLDRLWSWLSDLLAEVADRFKTDAARAREWEQVEGGPWSWEDEQRAQGVVESEPQPEPVTIVRVNHRYRDPGMTGQFPLVKVVGDKRAGRHRAEPEMPAVNVPAQREAAE